MIEVVDEILSNESILMNEAIKLMKKEIEKMNLEENIKKELIEEIILDVQNAFS